MMGFEGVEREGGGFFSKREKEWEGEAKKGDIRVNDSLYCSSQAKEQERCQQQEEAAGGPRINCK